MPVCPKCGWRGSSEDSCERCGIIYERMHTVFDASPLGALAAAAREARERAAADATKPAADATKPAAEATKPAAEATKPAAEATKPAAEATKPADATKRVPASVVPPRAAAADRPPHPPSAQSPTESVPVRRQMRTEREAVRVALPVVKPPERSSGGGVWALLFLAAAGLGAVVWWARPLATREAAPAPAEPPADAAWVRLATEVLLDDARAALRRVTEPETAEGARRTLAERSRLLRERLSPAMLTPDQYAAYVETLDALDAFLGEAALVAIGAARTSGARTPPTDARELDRARAACRRAARATASDQGLVVPAVVPVEPASAGGRPHDEPPAPGHAPDSGSAPAGD